MVCLQISIIGFGKDVDKKTFNLCVDIDTKVSYILEYLKRNFNMVFDPDEVMILCDDKQVYVDEPIPKECNVLVIFPLALGGIKVDDVGALV